jgi:hypothetical protein
LRTPRWKQRCRRNAPHEPRQHDQAENPHIVFGFEPVAAKHDPGIEFAPDWPLEGSGFELPVPREKRYRDLTNPGPACGGSSKTDPGTII